MADLLDSVLPTTTRRNLGVGPHDPLPTKKPSKGGGKKGNKQRRDLGVGPHAPLPVGTNSDNHIHDSSSNFVHFHCSYQPWNLTMSCSWVTSSSSSSQQSQMEPTESPVASSKQPQKDPTASPVVAASDAPSDVPSAAPVTSTSTETPTMATAPPPAEAVVDADGATESTKVRTMAQPSSRRGVLVVPNCEIVWSFLISRIFPQFASMCIRVQGKGKRGGSKGKGKRGF